MTIRNGSIGKRLASLVIGWCNLRQAEFGMVKRKVFLDTYERLAATEPLPDKKGD